MRTNTHGKCSVKGGFVGVRVELLQLDCIGKRRACGRRHGALQSENNNSNNNKQSVSSEIKLSSEDSQLLQTLEALFLEDEFVATHPRFCQCSRGSLVTGYVTVTAITQLVLKHVLASQLASQSIDQ